MPGSAAIVQVENRALADVDEQANVLAASGNEEMLVFAIIDIK